MSKDVFCVIAFFVFLKVSGQTQPKEFRLKKIQVVSDTIHVDSVSIHPRKFVLRTIDNQLISQEDYKMDFSTATLVLDKSKFTQIIVEYYRYPDFVTKIYAPFDKRLIVENTQNTQKLYSQTTNKKKETTQLFDGLKTQGFIVRGVTSGNNQNVVTNSSLDLTIEGKLSNSVGISAHIFDTNFPLQQGGYSQNITDFDRIFVELYHKKWRVKGGDVSLTNKDSYFLNFDKQVSGVAVTADLNSKTKIGASGAIVRGKFSVHNFVGIEGNQGPYKIFGASGESAIVMIEGSDKVFVNGILLKRGETNDYTIDYNLSEIRFNTQYPITNDMRVRIEFQYADRNYTRFITYDKAAYTSDKFSLRGYFYSENDAKNQPIQQNITDEQKQLLAEAGNDQTKMVVPSAYEDVFTPNRIQYKKVIQGQQEYFEYTTDENATVYSVTFTRVGTNLGDYEVDTVTAIGTVYKYVGENLGSFAPETRIFAPNKLQIAVVNSSYSPSERTAFDAEVAFSNNDPNLFSRIDDQENKKMAAKVGWHQVLMDKSWKVTSAVKYKFIQDNFRTVQRFQSVEFNRDWNLETLQGNQHELGTMLSFMKDKNTNISYGFHHLSFKDHFTGNKQEINATMALDNTLIGVNGSLLLNETSARKDYFFRWNSKLVHSFNKSWFGATMNLETNQRKETATQNLEGNSHRFQDYGAYYGMGDSTKVFGKVGVHFRKNDSVRAFSFAEINNRKTLYLESNIIQSKHAQLYAYANYRLTKNAFSGNETTINSKIRYRQKLWKGFCNLSTFYETSSGNIARQEFVYVKTEPGQGFYTWIDYNGDGIEQFDEFEVAQFQDQATYLRVALPNVNFLATQRVHWKQSMTLNPISWKNHKGIKRVLSHFYNQTYLTVNNEQVRNNTTFLWNPFYGGSDNQVGLQVNFRNNFYFNRNRQYYSWIYTFGSSRQKQQFFIGNQRNESYIHQWAFQHKLSRFWLFDVKGAVSENTLETENLTNRNYQITTQEVQPKFTFLYHKDHRFSLYYHFKKKENKRMDYEKLSQQKLQLSYFLVTPKKNQFSADASLFLNSFEGNPNLPVGYQMLEGLQVGKNFTWNMQWTQKLTSILNFSLNYMGRKSENSKTIHTGTVQLKAVF